MQLAKSLVLLASLITSTASAAVDPDALLDAALQAEIGRAPLLPPWPEGLPPAYGMEEGVLLPDELAHEVLFRLNLLDEYPTACQAALDAQGIVLGEQTSAAVLAAHVDGRRALLEQAAEMQPGVRFSDVVIAIAGTAVVGLAIGYAAGHLYP